MNTFTERMRTAAETVPGVYDAARTIVQAAMQPTAPEGARAILEGLVDSDIGGPLALHLDSNPRERARIASLPFPRALVAIGRLEAKLSAAPATKKTTTAPAPITAVGTGGGAVRDIGDPKLSTEERIGALRKARAET
jgi:hypothetical protein